MAEKKHETVKIYFVATVEVVVVHFAVAADLRVLRPAGGARGPGLRLFGDIHHGLDVLGILLLAALQGFNFTLLLLNDFPHFFRAGHVGGKRDAGGCQQGCSQANA